ncbi:4-amino-4-deoxy-L-arabinose transferase-like glycosyltransferase [Aliiruegeria haliotis]|uniref:4-amino-4-deoxy-L-arabinose transferase-like glycosyltransferase n=1 Tax=Aliiruegeria haliotis TaxID=1280846 RepID=A0A2T0RPC2_9RHOB|nr:glycosyltransferase family 39 protein [Aliiruegeria haliotis]PRY23018.1 4-amino-4-deoxy-L-arabinose transferase-like glycosyltransferase [Aliiruegeria haliotis]
MQNAVASRSDNRGWIAPAALIVLAVTAFRVVLLAANRTDLFVDEAQYWLWGREMALGYYSKPPMIGWVIRLSTELGGSDSAFWVRLPAPLLHAITAMILGAIAAPRTGDRVAIWVAATYVTLPMVTAGSLLMSTDTIMVPFLAAALWAWLRGLERGGTVPMAMLAGAMLGIAFLGKYAAVYYVICATLAAALMWQARPGWRPALAGLATFLIAISPNIWWNLVNGMSTVEHTLDNADWVRDPGDRASLNFAGLAEFLASQLFVFGPVLFVALLWLAGSVRRRTPDQGILLLFSLPILLIVSAQALLSEAYPNWAATAYVAGTLLVVPWLLGKRLIWIRASIAIHLFLAILLPVATVVGTGWRAAPDGPLLLERYVGRTDMSAQILAEAAEQQVVAIVADDRDILADLFHIGRESDIAVYARPMAGRAPNHYVLKYSLPKGVDGPVLFVSKRQTPRLPCEATQIRRIAPTLGAYRKRPQGLYVIDAGCLSLQQ